MWPRPHWPLPPSPVAALDVRSLLETIPIQVWQALLLTGIALSVLILYRIAQPGGRWAGRLRSRFLLGVPWGTVLGLGTVVAVYLFVQGGLAHPKDPVSLPFRATSYAYPPGVLLAGFAHDGWGHLLGNLFSGFVFGSIAEYAWSHYPTRRGSQSFTSLDTNPLVRIGAFYVAILGLGLITAGLSWGPVIGFSGVVYVFAGFAIVFYPIATIVAVAGWSNLWHVWGALVDPYTIAEPNVVYSGVGWASLAIQDHLFGFLLGVVGATLVIRRRQRSASPGRLWLATMVYVITQGLWNVFWYLGNSQYVRLRALGTALVFVLVGLIVAAAAASDRPLLGRVPSLDPDAITGMVTPRRIAVGIIVVTLLGMSLIGVAINLSAPSGANMPADAIAVRDYEVAYVENVTNQQIAVVDLPLLEGATQVQTSGVVVYSEQRRLWHQVISKRALAARGSGRVLLGGIGWRRAVYVARSGWSTLGGDVTYRVYIQPAGGESRLVHTADPATADLTLANRTVSIRPAAGRFEVVVRRDNRTLATVQMPADGGNVTAGGIRFSRRGRNLYAAIDGTRIRIADRRKPPTRD